MANLPYNLATPLVMGFLDEVPAVKRMLVMVQKEVGERFVAIPRTPAYGAVSVKVAYWAEAKIVGLVPPTVFMPKPKVDSALVSIVRRPKPAVPVNVDRDWLFQLVRTGFGQRRKMLRRSLAELVKPVSFERAGISPVGAEELDVYAWGLLASYSPCVAGGRPPARSARRHRRRSGVSAAELRANAKLTLTLRVTGTREDGYHLIDAEMVALELHDVLTISAGDSLSATGPFAHRHADR